MRKTIVALLSLSAVGALAVAFVSCGGTNGGLGDVATGNQFVSTSCSPDTDCLSLRVDDRFLEANDVDTTGFRATLVDGSGAPLPGIQICFRMEVSDVATIFEPNGGCGITDSNGFVSGQLRARRRTGSYALIAEAPPSFFLEARQTIAFGESCVIDLTPSTRTLAEGDSEFLSACIECADETVSVGATVTFAGCGGGVPCTLSPTSGTTGNDGCVGSSILNTNTSSTSAQANITATSSGVGTDTSNFILEGPPAVCGNGVVESGEQCDDGNSTAGDGCSPTCTTTTQCSDGIDNDADTFTDLADPQCTGAADNSESV